MKVEAQIAAVGPLVTLGPAIAVNAAGDVAQAVGNVTTGTVMRVDPNTDVQGYEELVASLRLQVQQRDQFIRANG